MISEDIETCCPVYWSGAFLAQTLLPYYLVFCFFGILYAMGSFYFDGYLLERNIGLFQGAS